LPLLVGDRLFLEAPTIVRENPALRLGGAAPSHADDDVRQRGPGVLTVERRWHRGVIGMRLLRADDLEAVALEALLRSPERFGVDQVAVACRVGPSIDQRHQLNRHLVVLLDAPADQATGLGRVVRLAVPADRRYVSWIENERHSDFPSPSPPPSHFPVSRRGSRQYPVAESGAPATTTASGQPAVGRGPADRNRSAAPASAPGGAP